MADVQIVAGGVANAPLAYTVPGAAEIVLKALFASFDGTSAASSWFPCIRIVAPGGKVVGEYITDEAVAAGHSADVSFGPFLRSGTGAGAGELDFQLNDTLIATEPAIDFEDGGGVTWQINDDPGNDRAKVSAIVQTGDSTPSVTLTQVAAIDNLGAFNAFGTLTVMSNGNILSVWSAGPSEAVDAEVFHAISTTQGATWPVPTALETPSAGHTFNGPVGVVTLANGKVIVNYFEAVNGFAGPPISVHYITSTDNGVSWSAPATLTPYTNWSAAGGRLVQLASGRVLMPVYGRNIGDTKDRCGVLISDDGGVTWSSVVSVSGTGADENVNELALIQTPSGTVVAAMRTDDNAFYYRLTSSDNGSTWSAKASMGFAATPTYPEIILEPDTQVVFMPYRQNVTEFAVYRYSLDYGVTWGSEVSISGLVQEYAGGVPVDTDLLGFGLGLKSAPAQSDWYYYTARITRNRATKIISGSVDGTGAITHGHGFTANRTALGKTTITFSAAFTDVPQVLAVAWGTGANATNQATGNSAASGGSAPTISQCEVWTTNPAAGAFVDTGFDFVAILT